MGYNQKPTKGTNVNQKNKKNMPVKCREMEELIVRNPIMWVLYSPLTDAQHQTGSDVFFSNTFLSFHQELGD